MKKYLIIPLLIMLIVLPFVFFDVLPSIGDMKSAPNTHVSDYYIENSIKDANSENMVTAVIVDFRAFDTLLETTVMFLAGISVMIILASRPRAAQRMRSTLDAKKSKIKSIAPVFKTINKDVMITIIEPIILIYALYVLFHGEISLGGGFQAGALIGMVYLLDVLVIPDRHNLYRMSKSNSAMIAGLGTFIYCLCGILTLIGGGIFLEYSNLPLPLTEAMKHSMGILMVEIGVTVGVAGTIITIINSIMERVRFDDDNY